MDIRPTDLGPKRCTQLVVGLAALSVDAAKSSLADLSHLAENVRRVAAEAVSSIDAESEIERISPRPAVEKESAPEQQVLRR
jgi:hypothetical protein